MLAGAAALPLFALGRSTAAPPVGDDSLCREPAATSRLHVPGTSGYLGRLAPRGAPLTLIAAAGDGTTPGRLAYRVRHAGRDYVNPTLVLRPGERVRVTLDNRLDAATIAHWHGLAVDTANDGAGLTLVAPRERLAYDFEVRNRGALYWYHPHPHGATAQQTYDGLFGLIDVDDDDHAALRRALDLVPRHTELTLVLQDRRRGGYGASEKHARHGFMGDEAYVNGAPCPFVDAASRAYRLRLLNACNARTLRLAFRTAAGTRVPFTVVGNDGGLLPAPVAAREAFLAAAERLDLVLDLTAATPGETIVMESLAFDPMHGERSSAEAPAAWPDGGPRALMTLRVRDRVRYGGRMPATLSRIAPLDTTGARERPLRLGFNKDRWRINDRVFAMGETPIEVARDSTEIWLLRNYHTSMPHAMHLHGFAFEVLERETSPDAVAALAVDARARLASDLGRKDTVLVWPGESVRVAIRFDLPWPGPQTYMFHCHNLEHEDGGMMLGVRVA